ncbi:MAG: Na(+)-translocating NADH-quinone reductase subunit C [Saccharospirillaceae bacterium]|nr:Na(+)-translocating NADH-quinone reductase subunit C [Pseudomonadales bacterium]NRB80536.1 Na(+)-translocating NADH-quinone reductase subunit C [Saccharospirillaceae bacterium]
MAKNKETFGYTITVAFVVCLVCAVLVSVAAVALRPLQDINKQLDKKKNVLAAADLLGEYTISNAPNNYIETTFDEKIIIKLVDVASGKFDTTKSPEEVMSYDQKKAAKSAEKLDKKIDIAQIKRQAKLAIVYVVNDVDGNLEKVILPIHGYGLWSTLYGFIALEADLNTVIGLGFYAHAETPGLGGEVDSDAFKDQWPGKKIFDETGVMRIEVTKGGQAQNPTHQVDGLSGATLTTRGVDNLVKFWLGENGFGSFIVNLKNGDA